MFKIINKKVISETLKEFDILAPDTARNAKAGQFVMIRVDEFGERVPLTIVSTAPENGTVKVILQEVGKTTKVLGQLEAGEMVKDFLGPLGVPSKVEKYGTVVCIGGGVGIAAIYPIAKALKNAGNKVISILGSRMKDLLILEKEVEAVSDEYFVATNDGSVGIQGFVTTVLADVLSKQKIDIVFAVGPMPMMKAVFDMVKETEIPVRVSLETLMLDGIGMCGACRVTHFGKVKFACADGPEFDAYGLDFADILNRQKAYKSKEIEAEEYCKCKNDNR